MSDVAGPRQPIELIVAKGKKNLTKAEIEDRRARELKPFQDEIVAPRYLTAAEKTRFVKIADQLTKLGILGETDTETLARYVTAETQYEKITKDLRTLLKNNPDPKRDEYLEQLAAWTDAQERLAKLQDRYFKQAQTAAASLGLTITARCKLVAPKVEEAPKVNKFAQFGAG